MQIYDTQPVERLEIAVSYRLGEYKQVLRELVASEFSQKVDGTGPFRF